LGINRLSLGVQSANADELHVLGRAHTWEQAVESVALARTAGFDNLNLDLIYGLPGQTVADWRETLEAALALQPEHLSLYALSVEAGTALEARIACGTLPAPEADVAAEMYEMAEARLAQAGFFHYEISNWARAGGKHPSPGTWWPAGAGGTSSSETVSPLVCRHNLAYWRSASYLGFGAGAASWWEGRRWCNVRHPAEYVMRVEHGRPAAAEVEVIEPRLAMGERMMMGLRLAEGVRDASFRAHFGVSLGEVFGEELARLRELELLGWDGQVARLTPRGRLLGNRVFQEFLPD
jgi:oxygen-independent coproporphyrinogen-3 oxidase